MKVRELIEQLEGHNKDAEVVVNDGIICRRLGSVDRPIVANGWHLEGERTPSILIYTSAVVHLSSEPLPPEKITIEIDRDMAEWMVRYDHCPSEIRDACREVLK